MFCDKCGARVGDSQQFCHVCGKNLFPGAALRRTGTENHFRNLGILWLVISGLRLIPGALLFTGFHTWHLHSGFPFGFPFSGILAGMGSLFAISAILGLIAGYGLLERRPWARTLAIVLGVFALFDFPFGTALGIYTLWALHSPEAEQAYRSA